MKTLEAIRCAFEYVKTQSDFVNEFSPLRTHFVAKQHPDEFDRWIVLFEVVDCGIADHEVVANVIEEYIAIEIKLPERQPTVVLLEAVANHFMR